MLGSKGIRKFASDRWEGRKMMDFSGTNTVFAITTICYTIGMIIKCFPKICEECIPIIMSVTGALLGVAGMFLIKDFPAQDVINAIAVGIASGLSATGLHQMSKQVMQQKNNNR